MAEPNAVVLSHTKMNGERFCTNVAVGSGASLRQRRLRLPPNRPVTYHTFPFPAALAHTHWQPGRLVHVGFAGDVPPEHRRVTHPEDALFDPLTVRVSDRMLSAPELMEFVAPITFGTVQDLYPGALRENGKLFFHAGTPLGMSVGYVRCRSVEVYPYYEKLNARVVDAQGDTFEMSVNDAALIQKVKAGQARSAARYQDVLIRCSIADAYPGTDLRPYDPPRCYLMLSAILHP